jgi:heat shock protein HslJ
MKTYKFISIVGMLSVLLAACAAPVAVQPTPTPAPEVDAGALGNSQWQLDSLMVNGQLITLSPAQLPTIEFATDGKIGGSGGCNSYFGSYTVNGDEVSFGAIGSTKMACSEGMDQEGQFFAALEAARHINLTSNTSLELRSTDGQTELKFVNMPSPTTPGDASLTGKVWQLTQIENTTDGVVSAPATGVVPTLEFMDDGTISGNGGCNGFGGNYLVAEGNKLAFSEIISTLMACDNTDIETVYFNGLNSAESYAFVGDQLTMTASGGTVIMTFDSQ